MWGLFRNKCPSKKDIYSARAAAAAPCLLGRHGAGAILIEFCTLPQRATQIYILSSCDSCTIVVNRLNKNGGVWADRRNSNFCKKKLSFDTKKRKEKKMDQRNLSFRASIQSRAEQLRPLVMVLFPLARQCRQKNSRPPPFPALFFLLLNTIWWWVWRAD